MAWMSLLSGFVLACVHPAPPPVEGSFDAATIPLDQVPPLLATELPHGDARALALRAHAAALVQERTPAAGARPEALLVRFRLHALAAELGEYAFVSQLGFYGLVGGVPVDLHDLRNAQLVAEAPELLTLDGGPAVERRLEHIRAHLAQVRDDPAFRDEALVLELLAEPIDRAPSVP